MTDSPSTSVRSHGECEPSFERVRRTFERHLADGLETGAAVAVTHNGRSVVDLWGGVADPDTGRAWERDTLVNLFSTTKGVVAIAALQLVEQGLLDLDRPVASYWPEFSAGGKETMPVRYLFNHRAGLAAVREPMPAEAMFDWDAMTGALAAETPWWEPGSTHGYHALTYGWLLGELIRRVTGKTPGRYLADHISGPLGLDLYIGLDSAEDARTARMSGMPTEPAPGEPSLYQIMTEDPESVGAKAFINPPATMLPDAANTRAWRGAEIPGANGHATARSLARLYGALAVGGDLDGVHVLTPDVIDQGRTEESYGKDLVLRVTTRFGLGFMLTHPDVPLGPREGGFGHVGAGGSVAFADPESGIGFSYVMNRMGPYILLDPRAKALMEAVYESL